jgi:hypothetical protein
VLPRFQPSWRAVSQVQHSAEVVEVAVAEDQSVGLARIDAEQVIIVQDAPAGESEIEQDLPLLFAAERF